MKAPVKESKNIDPVPEDTHHSICIAVYDLGTSYHEGYVYQDKKIPGGDRRDCVLIFEIPKQRFKFRKDDEEFDLPRTIPKKYNFSMSQNANLRRDMQTWRGRAFTDLEAADFEFRALLGANALLGIIHKSSKSQPDKKFAEIASITKLVEGMEKKRPETPVSFFCFDDSDANEFPNEMPEWVEKIIKESHEWAAKKAGEDIKTEMDEQPSEDPREGQHPENSDDDLPF